ncbi:hypothetical protein A5700_01805 [Mycobacterium sp. E1214]|nr:hypothetical protein A5700_01805 [Mycobacterium sp. E1214]OBH31607.1 hypothetical protein A5693_15935 [Mycobacterium sp. E1319]
MDWWSVHEHVERTAQRLGIHGWPTAGTAEWRELDDRDPAKILAVLDAGQHHALRMEVAQTAMAEASQAISAAADWAQISLEIRQRNDFYQAKPWLKRAAS